MTLPVYLRSLPDGCSLSVRVIPRAAKSALDGQQGDRLKIRLTAPPVEGKANKVLLGFLADLLSLPPSSLRLLQGETSREKRVFLPLAPEEAARRLAEAP